jgi:hypothetical protein
VSDTHNPCCPDHAYDYPMDCDRFRRTHIVEPGVDCCPEWAARGPQAWVPSGCPAGFSADCCYWTSNGICRCWSPPAVASAESGDAA